MEKQKKIVGRLELFSLLAGLLIFGYILVRYGCSPMERTETTELINNPGDSWGESRKSYKSGSKESVDQVLEQIATQFSGGKNPDYRALQNEGITEDEMNFYDQIKEEYGGEIDRAKNWYQVLKTARSTYQSVADVFADATGQPAETLRPIDLQQILDNPEKSANLFNQFARRFNKSSGEVADFARRSPGRQLSDWAMWLEEGR